MNRLVSKEASEVCAGVFAGPKAKRALTGQC